jgi:aspartyl-tRNA(Asn)/glutamyl-tRNA(Gln) amidotransferase subunit B
MVALIDQGKISGKLAKTVFEAMADSGSSPQEIIAEKGLEQVSDPESIEKAIDQVLIAHRKQVADYQAGNQKIFGFLVGQIMKATQGKVNPQKANEILKRKLTEGSKISATSGRKLD